MCSNNKKDVLVRFELKNIYVYLSFVLISKIPLFILSKYSNQMPFKQCADILNNTTIRTSWILPQKDWIYKALSVFVCTYFVIVTPNSKYKQVMSKNEKGKHTKCITQGT